MIKSTKAMTASSYLSMFFLGVALSLVGAAARNIGLSPYQIGLLITAQNVGFALSVSISGALADTYSKPKILLVGSLILALSFLTFYASDLFWINLLIILGIGIGAGTYEGVTDALLLDIHPRRAGFHINVNHFFVTFGSIMIAVYLLFLQLNWRNSIVQSGVIVLLLALFFGLARLEPKRRPAEPYLERLHILTRDRVIVALFVATALAVGIEAGTIGILTTTLAELHGFTQNAAQIGLVVFLAGIASGRLVVGFLTKNRQIARNLLALFGLSFLFFAALFFSEPGSLVFVPIYLAGAALSAILPLIITLAGLLYQDIAGTVMGAIKVAIPVGGIIIPFLMSQVARYASLQLSLLLFPLSALVGFLMLFWLIRHVKLPEAQAVTG